MTDYPTPTTPDLTSQADGSTARLSSPKSELAEVLAALSADAANWRTLLAELTARGFAEMSLTDILVCFPDFQELARAHTGANPPDAVAAAKCDFLDTDSLPFGATITLRSNPAHPGAITASHRTQPVDVFPGDLTSLGNVREFAEADTTLGMVNVGHTDEAVGRPTLAFTFAYTNDTYLLPIVDILSELISAIVARRPIWSRPHKPARLM